MKILTLLVSVLVTVVETSISAAIPAFLPIGDRFPPDDMYKVWVEIVNNSGQVGSVQTNFMYNRQTYGDLKTRIDFELKKLADSFVPVAGHEGDDYIPMFGVDQALHGNGEFGTPVANNNNIGKVFKLVRGSDNQLHFPAEALNVGIVYRSYIASPAPGLKWVKVEATTPNGRYTRDGENGSPKGCSLDRGGSNYEGPDVLQLSRDVVLGKMESDGTKLSGTVTLYFSDDRKVWGKYDISTGNLIASSALPPLSLKLSLTPAQLPTLAGTQSQPRFGMKVKIAGPSGSSVTLEYSDNLATSSWKPLTTLSLTSGSAEYTDEGASSSSLRFYRAALGK